MSLNDLAELSYFNTYEVVSSLSADQSSSVRFSDKKRANSQYNSVKVLWTSKQI